MTTSLFDTKILITWLARCKLTTSPSIELQSVACKDRCINCINGMQGCITCINGMQGCINCSNGMQGCITCINGMQGINGMQRCSTALMACKYSLSTCTFTIKTYVWGSFQRDWTTQSCRSSPHWTHRCSVHCYCLYSHSRFHNYYHNSYLCTGLWNWAVFWHSYDHHNGKLEMWTLSLD